MSRFVIVTMAAMPLLLTSCEIFGFGEPEYLHGCWASVEDVEVRSVKKGSVEFRCTISVGDPCHEFERADIDCDDIDVAIRLYSKREKARICADVITTLKTTIEVEVPGGEEYTFHFWRTDTVSLDTTLYVP